MSAGVSSERRVELIVEQVAWELRKIRDQGGKVVVNSWSSRNSYWWGHLAHLVRQGYVQALLGETRSLSTTLSKNLMGTSLCGYATRSCCQGVHRHHLKVINTIRRYGSIAKAVSKALLRAVYRRVCSQWRSFSLAGSIEMMDLCLIQMDLKAQQEYAQLLEGADMILMLSMLHSIGVGNMTILLE